MTYAIVLFVDLTFVLIGIVPAINDGYTTPYIHLVVFHILVFMIFWSHTVCMTTDPGCLPKDQQELNISLLSEEAKILYDKSIIAYSEIQKKREEDAKNKPRENPTKRVTLEMRSHRESSDSIDETSELLGMTATQKKYIVAVFRNKCRKCLSPKPPKSHH